MGKDVECFRLLNRSKFRAIQQLGPIRQRVGRDNALSVLVEHNWIRLANRNNQTMIEVNPNISMEH